jgi:hypothetical protein
MAERRVERLVGMLRDYDPAIWRVAPPQCLGLKFAIVREGIPKTAAKPK